MCRIELFSNAMAVCWHCMREATRDGVETNGSLFPAASRFVISESGRGGSGRTAACVLGSYQLSFGDCLC